MNSIFIQIVSLHTTMTPITAFQGNQLFLFLIIILFDINGSIWFSWHCYWRSFHFNYAFEAPLDPIPCQCFFWLQSELIVKRMSISLILISISYQLVSFWNQCFLWFPMEMLLKVILYVIEGHSICYWRSFYIHCSFKPHWTSFHINFLLITKWTQCEKNVNILDSCVN